MDRRFMWKLCALVLGCIAALGQTQPKVQGGCPRGMNYAKHGYRIRSARIEDPWRFLRTVRARRQGPDEADKAVAGLENQPYNNAEVEKVLRTVERVRFLETNITYSAVVVDNCSGKELDIIYRVFSIQISPALSSTFEFRQKEKTDPQEAAGISGNKQAHRLTPRAGYNRTQRLFGGGSLETHWNAAGVPLNSLFVEGLGSSSMHSVSATLSGGHESATSWLAHSEWRLDFKNSSLPTDQASLDQGRLALEYAAESRPFHGVVMRLGTMVEGGNQQSSFSGANLAPGTLASSNYGSVKFYGGMTAHPRNQALSVSYGLELGATGAAFRNDWRRHLGDVAHEIWWGDHGRFDIEQRFTAGLIQTPGRIPVGERFFGGNSEEQFVPGNTWQFRSNPFIRSIPANRFYRTSAGAGGDQFAAYNLTAAVIVWNIPLVPPELTGDPDFTKKITGVIASATNTLQVVNASSDPHFRDLLHLLPDLKTRLDALSDAVTKANTGAPESLDSAFQDCSDAIDSSSSLVRHAIKDKPLQAYGSVQELFPDGSGALSDIVSKCDATLNATLHNAAITSAAAAIDASAKQLQSGFGQINQGAALKKAQADMSYVTRTLDIILHEMNISSLSPVIAFDAVHIGPATIGPYSGTRYGLGGGIRFALASTVNFTAGYSWNPDRRPGEGVGALFFSLNTKSLFQ